MNAHRRTTCALAEVTNSTARRARTQKHSVAPTPVTDRNLINNARPAENRTMVPQTTTSVVCGSLVQPQPHLSLHCNDSYFSSPFTEVSQPSMSHTSPVTVRSAETDECHDGYPDLERYYEDCTTTKYQQERVAEESSKQYEVDVNAVRHSMGYEAFRLPTPEILPLPGDPWEDVQVGGLDDNGLFSL